MAEGADLRLAGFEEKPIERVRVFRRSPQQTDRIEAMLPEHDRQLEEGRALSGTHGEGDSKLHRVKGVGCRRPLARAAAAGCIAVRGQVDASLGPRPVRTSERLPRTGSLRRGNRKPSRRRSDGRARAITGLP